MSREKERFSRLVSWMRSEDKCSPLSPCCSAVGETTLGIPDGLSESAEEVSEVVLRNSSSAFSEVDNVWCLLPSSASSWSCWASPSPFSPWAFKALSSFRLLSYSRSWPRKLKLGDMEGRRSLTNLPMQTKQWCLLLDMPHFKFNWIF